jgi:REP-associated tyrosine transposase
MSRLRRIERVGRYFFITTNLIRGTPPFSAAERDICLNCLGAARNRFGLLLFAYVIMLDHVHLLLSTFQSDLPAIMRVWKSESALAIQKSRDDRGAIWQSRYFDFILRRASDFSRKLAYIHENPVLAKLTERPEEWLWSSAAFYAGGDHTMLRPDQFDIPTDPNEPLWPVPGR